MLSIFILSIILFILHLRNDCINQTKKNIYINVLKKQALKINAKKNTYALLNLDFQNKICNKCESKLEQDSIHLYLSCKL